MGNKQKNIMLVVPMLDQGGLERMCVLTARLLKEYANVIIVVFNGTGIFYDITGLQVIDLKLGSVSGKLGKCMQVLRRVVALRRLRKEHHIDICYSFGDTANLSNIFSGSKGETWCGIRAYGSLADVRTMKLVCKFSHKIIACSEVIAREIKRTYGVNNVEVLYNPCDLEMIQEKAKMSIANNGPFTQDNRFTVMAMGRAHDVKGFWHLLKAFSIMKQEVEQCHLVFVGDGDFTGYKNLAEALGVGDDVTFAGLQNNPFALLNYANLYVLTSESEGFPNALIEAMAVGVPVMSVNCKSGPAEILAEDYTAVENCTKVYYEKYGILLPIINGVKNLNPNDLEQEDRTIAREMIQFYENQEMQVRYTKMAKERARDFSNDKYVQKLLNMV